MTPEQKRAGADRVRAWANPRVFNEDQCEVIRTWADRLEAAGLAAILEPVWPSRMRSTQQSRAATAFRLFTVGSGYRPEEARR